MKKLNELYETDEKIEILNIKTNSKEIEKGDLFVCTKGFSTDRHDYVEDAIKNGAVAIIASKKIDVNVPVIYVEDTNKELIELCKKFYDDPFSKLTVIGVTGTDGKTSTATIIQTLIGNDVCGYIGTNGYSCSKFKRDTDNTSPAPEKLFMYLNEFIDCGCKYVVLEASSEAFYNKRINYIEFDHSVFTNITPEHMNTHKTIENLIDCKGQLFIQTKNSGYKVLNKDTEHYKDILRYCKNNVVTYGKESDNDLIINDFKLTPKNTIIQFTYNNNSYEVDSPMLGEFNVYNLSAGLLLCLSIGFSFEELEKNIKNINVSGRIDILDTNTDFSVIVDYAHTPNGIKNILNFVKMLDFNRSIVVIGSAGERDRDKRPLMGKTVVNNADHVIFTYEDPRSEDPLDIIDMLITDVKEKNNYEIVVDRKEAINKAISIAEKDDMVLILGKGNETYQKLKDKKIYFNDIEEAYNAIKNKK